MKPNDRVHPLYTFGLGSAVGEREMEGIALLNVKRRGLGKRKRLRRMAGKWRVGKAGDPCCAAKSATAG